MSKPLLGDAFGHHVWATIRLIDACLVLEPSQLEATVPGTYGPITTRCATSSRRTAGTSSR